jgi:DedD protein
MQKLKERLFGMTVVVSLSVIFVPMLLTGNDEHKLNLAQTIPQTPDVLPSNQAYAQHAHYFSSNSTAAHTEHELYSDTPEAMMQNNDILSNTNTNTNTKTITSKPLAVESTESTVLDTAGAVQPEPNALSQVIDTNVAIQSAEQVHQTWVVRLATFGNPKNAQKLAVRLKQDGYAAYTQASKRSDKAYTFVLVGANTEKKAAKKLNDDLRFKYNLQGLVVEQQSDTRG